MKKMGIICLLLLLTACGGVDSAKRSTVCSLGYDNVSDTYKSIVYQQSFDSEGDYISYMVIESTFEMYKSADSFIEAEEEYAEQFVDIAGVSYEYEINDAIVVERIIIDLDLADMNDLVSLGLVVSEDGELPAYISYSSTIDSLENEKYTCQSEVLE